MEKKDDITKGFIVRLDETSLEKTRDLGRMEKSQQCGCRHTTKRGRKQSNTTRKDSKRIEDNEDNDKGEHGPGKLRTVRALGPLGLEIWWEACGVH